MRADVVQQAGGQEQCTRLITGCRGRVGVDADQLRIVAELIVDMDRFKASTGDADNCLVEWDRLARSNMADTTLPLHRRYAAISLCFNELGRRAATRRRPDHRLFVSDLIDLVTGVLLADVSDETRHLLDERQRQRLKKQRSTSTEKAAT